MLPLLKRLADSGEHKFSGLVADLGSDFGLTQEELSEVLPSGTQPIFANRVGWARLYLKKAGLLDASKRGFLQITERGRKILSEGHERIDTKFPERFQEFVAFRQRDSTVASEPLSPSHLRRSLVRRSKCSKMLMVGFGLGSPMSFSKLFKRSIQSDSSRS